MIYIYLQNIVVLFKVPTYFWLLLCISAYYYNARTYVLMFLSAQCPCLLHKYYVLTAIVFAVGTYYNG